MGRRGLLGTFAVGAAIMLLSGERAWTQRYPPAGKKSQFSTRPIQRRDDVRAAEQDVATDDRAVRPAAHEQPDHAPRDTQAPRDTRAPVGLPNDHGQVWREYDLTPYVERIVDHPRPEQAVVDWILRETGYESWHAEPVALLSASRDKLRVYHTPQMQATVGEIVDRFVSPEQADHAVGLRIVSIGASHWRSRMPARLTPIEVQSPGAQAWLMAKEEAAVLLAELSRRNDFREYGSPRQLVLNGQPTVVSTLRPRSYTQHLLPGVSGGPGYQPRAGEVEEGIAVELTPLASRDGDSIDAVIRCNVDQLERLVPVTIESNLAKLGRERSKVEIPQRAQLRFKESFRLSVDEVLLVSLGIVPLPDLSTDSLLEKAIPLALPSSAPRAELLLLIESHGHRASPPANAAASPRSAHGRY